MHSPRETRSKRQSFSFRILSMSLSCRCCMQQSSDSNSGGKRGERSWLSFCHSVRLGRELRRKLGSFGDFCRAALSESKWTRRFFKNGAWRGTLGHGLPFASERDQAHRHTV